MNRILYILIGIVWPYMLNAQYFLELHSESDNSFREWEILLENDSIEIEGDLELTWSIDNDFTQWQYRIEDLFGEISQKFSNNPGFWELRSEGRVVTIRQVWPGDITEWKISHKDQSFIFKVVYPNRLDEWSITDEKFGELVLYTERIGDPRDWIISDYTIESITFEERLAAIFIGLYSSIPKF